MIPFNPAVFVYLYIAEMLLWITPLFILMTLLIVVRIFYVARKEQSAFWQYFFKRKLFAIFSIIIVIITVLLSVISWEVLTMKRELQRLNEPDSAYEQRMRNQKMRQNFVLEHDHQYGEFIFPKGTLINRYDPSDDGEEDYPLILSGLRSAEFPEPIEFAGILTTRIEARGLVELAEDQNVGPIHYYSSKYGEYGGWVEDRTTPTMFCPKGSIALFEKPSGPDINLDDEFWWRDKDGLEAHFKPSEWQFRSCDNRFEIDILPAFGTPEAIALEEAEDVRRAAEDRVPQTIVKDGVVMDAEPVEFTISFYLEAMNHYHFSAKKSGLAEDYEKAYQLFLQAAENGEEEAYYYLGIMNLYGEGVPKNMEEALVWLNKAADSGDTAAASVIGSVYLKYETFQDYAQALDIFKKVAEKGDPAAEFYLGMMYAEGLGVEQNYETALIWLKKAAHLQHGFGMTGQHHLSVLAAMNVGQIYAEGLIGEKDPKAAELWFEKACYLDAKEACQLLEEIKQSL